MEKNVLCVTQACGAGSDDNNLIEPDNPCRRKARRGLTHSIVLTDNIADLRMEYEIESQKVQCGRGVDDNSIKKMQGRYYREKNKSNGADLKVKFT